VLVLSSVSQLKFVLVDCLNTGYFRALDLSQNPGDHQAVMYADVETNMTFIVSELPLLKWLDISGTNLCGWMPEPPVSHRLFDTKSQRYQS